MRKYYLFIPVFLLFLAVLIVSASRFFLPQLLSVIFSKQFKAEVRIDEASLGLKDGIKIKGISISNKRGLRCDIESAEVEYDIISLIKEGLNFAFLLKNVELSYPESAVVNGIAKGLSLKQPDLFRFDTASGRLYRRNRELIYKALNATGKHIRLFIDGTVTDDSRINASFRILLSEELVSGIPEAARKVFFKQDGSWSKVELYLSGDSRRPSINFSTDLFKLIVH